MLPQHILDKFARIPHNCGALVGNTYYGVFNKILTKVCFRATKGPFTVCPQYPLLGAGVPTTIDSVVYVVEVNDVPVFFLEIQSPSHWHHLNLISTSTIDAEIADKQMRARFCALYHLTQTPRRHGISAVGQRLAFYCLDKVTGHINYNYIAQSTNDITNTVLAEKWTDITTEEGYQRFMAVINDVKEMAAAL
jgi:hypothetical protein